jgi:hypothetical protein
MGERVMWRRMGLVFSPNGENSWMKSHAQVPTPILIGSVLRVYISARPQRNLSLATFVDLDANNPSTITHIEASSLLPLGKAGSFDEHGIMPSCAIVEDDLVLLYYSGWSRAASVPYTNSTGLAISRDGGRTFVKYSEGPILSKGIHDPFSATSPCVLHDQSGWHMWYCSGTGWHDINGKLEHTYDIKYAHSADGRAWSATGHSAICQRDPLEAITRPYVIRSRDGYHMWFCHRGSRDFRDGVDAYRIGYAASEDGRNWQRQDEIAGLEPGIAGFDSTMVAYPAVIVVKGRILMFYNGNGFGRSGFGYAQWSEGSLPWSTIASR